MSFLHNFSALGYGVIVYTIPFLCVLTVIVFIHELGHFLVARWAGVKVLTFSIGFGPELAGFNDRHGTRWKLSAIPLGGYVKFFGDESEASTPSAEALAGMSEQERAVSFHHKKVAPRAAIVAAGPIANFLLAIAIFTCVFTFFGKPVMTARVDQVEPNSAAAAAGFQVGDIVTSIDGQHIGTFSDMQWIVSTHPAEKLNFTVKRGDAQVQIEATPELRERKDTLGNVSRGGVLGITRQNAASDTVTEPVNPATALWLGVKQTWQVVERTFVMVGGIFTGRQSADQVSGAIGIAKLSGQVASTGGLFGIVELVAFLSISIGLLNLFPVPLLDGGHLLYYAIEAVRGRPMSERAQEVGFRIGLAFVVLLMVFATYNDILRLAKS